jgi:mannose-6-phosphate isomerase-like protein (cupin superfamily)
MNTSKSPRPVSRKSAEHYVWGGNCDGWYLVTQPTLSVIEERMPPEASEVRHNHMQARQFFYVLEGELTLEIEGEEVTLGPSDGIEIHPGQKHTAMNRSSTEVRMLVTSQPPSHGDRIVSG